MTIEQIKEFEEYVNHLNEDYYKKVKLELGEDSRAALVRIRTAKKIANIFNLKIEGLTK